MDPLSFAASLAAVIQLSAKAAQYLKDVKSGSQDRVRLRDEIRGTSCLLEMLQDRVEDADCLAKDLASIRSLDMPGGPMDQLSCALEQLISKLAPTSRVSQVSRAIFWPFNKEEVNELVGSIERQKTAFNLAISNDNIALSLAMKTQMTEMRDQLTAIELRNSRGQAKSMAQEDETILAWLSPLTFEARQHDVLSTRTENTGKWLLETAHYQSWRQGAETTLWCHGIPGAGKTVLASMIIEDLLQSQSSPKHAVVFIYCNYKERAQQTCDLLISSLLRQLLDRGVAIPDKLRSLYNANKDSANRPSKTELLALLTTAASEFDVLSFVIDALDECNEVDGARSMLLSGLRTLLPNGRFLYTSRPLREIESRFEGCSQLEILASDEDIRKYVERRIPNESRLAKHIAADPTLLATVRDTIVTRSEGMFLLAQLHLSALASKHTRKALRAGLQSLPTQIDVTYDEALRRIHDQGTEDAGLADHVLTWISQAIGPLTVAEIQQAIAAMDLEKGTEIDEEDLPDEDIMISVCAGLAIIDKESSVVRLVHYTAQDYLQRNPLLDHDTARRIITNACITYLSQNAFAVGPCGTNQALSHRFQKYPLLHYAAHNWGFHAQGPAEETCMQSILEFLQDQNLRDSSRQASSANIKYSTSDERIHWSQSYSRDVSMLTTAAGFGLTDTVKMLLSEGHDVEVRNSYGETALLWACGKGHIDTTAALINAGADINKSEVSGRSPLISAASNGYCELVALLIDNGAMITAESIHGITPLESALRNGHSSTAMRLIKRGAKVELSNDPIHAAVDGGDMEMIAYITEEVKKTKAKADIDSSILRMLLPGGGVPSAGKLKLLVEKGADLDYRGERDEAPIHVAVRRDFGNILENLLNLGADIDAQNAIGYTPLHWATFKGDRKMVKTLLGRGANISALSNAGETVLHSCLHYASHVDLVFYLLEQGVHSHATESRGQTVLHEAAYRGFLTVLRIMLDHGADVNCKDNQGRTALQLAAASGQEDVVDELLEQPKTQDKLSYRPLLDAAHLRHGIATKDNQVIQRLLQDPAVDVTVPDHEGRTALHHAAFNGQADIVKKLIQRGASVNARILDSAYEYRVCYIGHIETSTFYCQWITPLHNAAGKAHADIVQILLDHGAEVHSAGSENYHPLYLAVRTGNPVVVKILLNHGADVDARVEEGEPTPLYWAATKGHEEVLRLLLEHGADRERDTEYGRKALWMATRMHHAGVINVMTEYGFKPPE